MATPDDRLIIKQAKEKTNDSDPDGVKLLDEGQDFTPETLVCIGDLIKKHKAEVQPAGDFLDAIPGSIEVVDAEPHASDVELDQDGGIVITAAGKSTVKSARFELGSLKGKEPGKYTPKDAEHVLSSMPDGNLQVNGQTTATKPEPAGGFPGTAKLAAQDYFLKLSQAQLSHNRFTPEAGGAFLEGSVSETDFDQQSGAMIQALLGVHKKDGKHASFEHLSKIGSQLMHRAVGIDVDDPDTIDADFVGEIIASIFTAQGGVTKLHPRSVEVSDLQGFAALKPDGIQSEVVADQLDLNLYGINPVMNTDILPFGGFAPVGMIFLALALSTALSLVLKGIFQLISWGGNSDSLVISHMPGRFVDRANEIGFGILSLADIGIRDTNHNFAACVDRGIDVFFGLIDTSEPVNTTDGFSATGAAIGTAAGALASATMTGKTFAKITRSPGYYAIVCRQILKSGNDLARFSLDLGKNPSTAFQGFLNYSDHLKSSKIIAALNLFAGLGDIALRLENIDKDSGLGQITDFLGQFRNSSDGIVSFADNNLDFGKGNVGVTRVAKGRVDGRRVNGALTSKGRRQTISTGLIPSALIMPTAPRDAAKIFGKEASLDAAVNKLHNLETVEDIELRTMVANRRSRINPDIANRIEQQLDAEYMPFYFRDMRTNEIIAFHAFLKGLNDTYSVKWEETNAYGRVDPVMTYANTRRAISVQFTIAAMGKNDFQEMWLKINKLVTLVYPQWSAGRQVQLGNGSKFIQPFSQIPSASPLVRIRLGDLFKSNYSQFALARLFGAGTSQFTVGEAEKTKTKAPTADTPPAPKVSKKTPNIGDRFSDGLLSRGGFKAGDKVFHSPSRFVGTGASADFTGAVHGTIVEQNLKNSKWIIKPTAGGGVFEADARYLTKVKDSLELHKIDAKPNPAAVKQLKEQKKFFSPESNSIFRAFEENKGKGLAGVISSLSFDWHEAVWEIDEGSKAPQWCTVNIEFQPIHDIAPGIGHDGFNRAPVYNVGDLMKDLS